MSVRDEIGNWTIIVNEIVNILRCELDGGFLEDTKKYDGGGEELIYSCLRAIASQILAIPQIKECLELLEKKGEYDIAIVDRKAKLPVNAYVLTCYAKIIEVME